MSTFWREWVPGRRSGRLHSPSNLTGELETFRDLFDILATPDIVAVVPLDVLGLGDFLTPLPASAAGQTIRGQVVVVEDGVVEVTEVVATFILF